MLFLRNYVCVCFFIHKKENKFIPKLNFFGDLILICYHLIYNSIKYLEVTQQISEFKKKKNNR